jgi:hypothetical protein
VGNRTSYAPAPEVAAIAERLIELFHPHLHGVRIEYVFLSEPPLRLRRPLAGRARIVSGLNAFLATPGFEGEPEPFFCIEITKPIWDAWRVEKRIALVDHELKHCGYDDEFDEICLIPHDEEEFDDIAERHGAWEEGLERFGDALERGRRRQEGFSLEEYEGVKRAARRKTKTAPDRVDLRRASH